MSVRIGGLAAAALESAGVAPSDGAAIERARSRSPDRLERDRDIVAADLRAGLTTLSRSMGMRKAVKLSPHGRLFDS
jgi:hypothetical protein